jgi:hypothetical protein
LIHTTKQGRSNTRYLVNSLVLPANDVCSSNVPSSGELDTLLGDRDNNCNAHKPPSDMYKKQRRQVQQISFTGVADAAEISFKVPEADSTKSYNKSDITNLVLIS